MIPKYGENFIQASRKNFNYQSRNTHADIIKQVAAKKRGNNVIVKGVNTFSQPTLSPPAFSAPNPVSQVISGSLQDSSYENQLKDKKNDMENMLDERKKSYNKRYGQLSKMIMARKGDAVSERDRNMTVINAELKNLMSKADVAKQDVGAYYDQQKGDLEGEKQKLDEKTGKIFQARNLADSSYYINAQKENDTEFLKTLEKMGGEKARQLSKLDTDIQYYQVQAVNKKAEIEQAYNETIRSIQDDWTKTQWEKEDAVQQLEQEFSDKMDALDERILSYSMEQQKFRTSVAQWAYEEGYKNTDWKGGLPNSDKYKMNESQRLLETKGVKYGEDSFADPYDYARLRSESSDPYRFDRMYGQELSQPEQINLGLKSAATKSATKNQKKNISFEDL